MGQFVSAIHLRSIEQNRVVISLDACLKQYGLSRKAYYRVPQGGPHLLPDHDNWVSEGAYYFISAKCGDWLTIVAAHEAVDNMPDMAELSEHLSKALSTYALCFVVHDSDIFYYNLCYKGVAKDGYNSCPQYFEEKRLSKDAVEARRHSPKELQPILPNTVSIQQVEQILNTGWWTAYNTGKLDSDGVELDADEKYLFEENRMAELGELLQLAGPNNKYPYALWPDSDAIKWEQFTAFRAR